VFLADIRVASRRRKTAKAALAPSSRRRLYAGGNEMPNVRDAGHVRMQPLLDLAIRFGRACVLTQMFGPGPDEECLDVAVRLLEVPEHAPPECAIPTSNAAVLLD